MTSRDHKAGDRPRACWDRCEVCNAVIRQRAVPSRRRCAEHLEQLALVPVPKKKSSKGTGEGR